LRFRVADVDPAHRGPGGDVPNLVRRKPAVADTTRAVECERTGASPGQEFKSISGRKRMRGTCKRDAQARDDRRRSGSRLREPFTGLSWRWSWFGGQRVASPPRKRARVRELSQRDWMHGRCLRATANVRFGKCLVKAPPARKARGVGLLDGGHTRRFRTSCSRGGARQGPMTLVEANSPRHAVRLRQRELAWSSLAPRTQPRCTVRFG